MNIELTILQNQIEELMNVRGIGEAAFLKLRGLVTITAPRTDRAPHGGDGHRRAPAPHVAESPEGMGGSPVSGGAHGSGTDVWGESF